MHPVWGRRLGFASEIATVQGCRTPEELAELILHSSCTPPLLPAYRRGGRPVLDGGLVDGVPVELVPEARSALVLVPRHLPEAAIPRVSGRTYVVPSRPIQVEVWDYTSPRLIQEAFDQGRRDGEAFATERLYARREPARVTTQRVSGDASLAPSVG
jgi:predicted acylesterase/phospholipase RssA